MNDYGCGVVVSGDSARAKSLMRKVWGGAVDCGAEFRCLGNSVRGEVVVRWFLGFDTIFSGGHRSNIVLSADVVSRAIPYRVNTIFTLKLFWARS
jgi:hypothetical protein